MVSFSQKWRLKTAGNNGTWTSITGCNQGASLMNGQTVSFTGVNGLSGMFTCSVAAGQQIELKTEFLNAMTQIPIEVFTDTITVVAP